MVNKVVVRFVCAGLLVLCFLGCVSAVFDTSPPATPKEKVIIELQMIPVDGADGEFILEYSNGVRELLKKDGTRLVLTKKD
jgi:hypothetical protein